MELLYGQGGDIMDQTEPGEVLSAWGGSVHWYKYRAESKEESPS